MPIQYRWNAPKLKLLNGEGHVGVEWEPGDGRILQRVWQFSNSLDRRKRLHAEQAPQDETQWLILSDRHRQRIVRGWSASSGTYCGPGRGSSETAPSATCRQPPHFDFDPAFYERLQGPGRKVKMNWDCPCEHLPALPEPAT